MKHCIVATISMIVGICSCDSGGLVIVETKDAGADVAQDALEPVDPPSDASVCGNGNPGTGACSDPVKDCPKEDACWRFECVMGQNEVKVCGSIAKSDGGP